MLYRLLLIVLMLVLVIPAVMSAPDIDSALDRAQQTTGEMRAHTADVFDNADALSTSPDFLNDLHREATTLIDSTGTLPVPALPNLPAPTAELMQRTRADINKLLDQAQGQQAPTSMEQKSGPQLYVFVSFSMPDITVKRLLTQASRIDGSLILRGLVDNDLGKTKDKIIRLLEADATGNTKIKGGFAIDPTLFERFDISLVPAFVLTNTPAERCSETGCPDTDYVRVAGDTTLLYALETIAREAPAMRDSTDTLLMRMREGG